jgi:hypothetical protein
MQVLVDIGAYTRVYLRKGVYTSKSVPNLGCTTDLTLICLYVVVFL